MFTLPRPTPPGVLQLPNPQAGTIRVVINRATLKKEVTRQPTGGAGHVGFEGTGKKSAANAGVTAVCAAGREVRGAARGAKRVKVYSTHEQLADVMLRYGQRGQLEAMGVLPRAAALACEPCARGGGAHGESCSAAGVNEEATTSDGSTAGGAARACAPVEVTTSTSISSMEAPREHIVEGGAVEE